MNSNLPAPDDDQALLDLRPKLHLLRPPENPYRVNMLEAVEQLKGEIETEQVEAFALMRIAPNGRFTVRVLGPINTLELIGLLETAKIDILDNGKV